LSPPGWSAAIVQALADFIVTVVPLTERRRWCSGTVNVTFCPGGRVDWKIGPPAWNVGIGVTVGKLIVCAAC
jgi:hypothetical protein